jgi:hypothetical protein
MNWKDERATEGQLGHLRQLGHEPEYPLTKGEAARLIAGFEAHKGPTYFSEETCLELATHSAFRLRLAVEQAKRDAESLKPQAQNPQHVVEMAMAERQEFWADTCSDADKVHLVPPQVLALHKKHGHRFATPTLEQVQTVLDALDEVMLLWDRDYPELFYQTLELNFPALLRHQGAS